MTAPGTLDSVRRALEGDDAERARLLDRVRPRLVLWAAARMSGELRRHCEPEDVAQEVLLAVHRDFERLAPRAADEFLPWLFGVAENRLRDLVDRVRAAKRNGEPPPPKSQPSPSSDAARRDSLTQLATALATLSDDHRRVLRLRCFEDRPAAEVGREMGRSQGAVRVLYFRALGALRDAMGEGSA